MAESSKGAYMLTISDIFLLTQELLLDPQCVFSVIAKVAMVIWV